MLKWRFVPCSVVGRDWIGEFARSFFCDGFLCRFLELAGRAISGSF